VKSAKVLGRAEAKRRDQDDHFSVIEMENNKEQFEELENLLQIRGPDTKFRRSLIELISQCRSMHSMWSNAPRRNLIKEELKTLRKNCRQRPDDISKHFEDLSSEALYCLEKNGLLEASEGAPLMKTITATIESVAKDIGGAPAKEDQRFLVDQFAQYCKSQTRLDPALTYSEYNNTYGGTFLECLCIVYKLAFKREANRGAIADTFKLLFYNNK